MGELNLDNIDRALMQEYQSCRDGYQFKEAARQFGNLYSGRKAPAHIRCGQTSSESNCVNIRKY